ncbi:hypothetical protein AVEN_186043-1 [Araneus ventricosus]|uniref:Uncharacterized protein n=1 Tax=Araneus ventricosus TaxID=182803 RepID=A0A4Y2QF99_ARAVE|nr:hypothetical protein AVEN_271607-1 [Araneus ventricosus]GBN62380.1 hypothetical protein AVEN_186043-1 [Araneus ventricosus]
MFLACPSSKSSYSLPTEVGRTMLTLPALLYLKLLPLFGQWLYHLIVPNKCRPTHAGGAAFPRWSSTGLTPFLGRPDQCGYFYATPTVGHLATTYDLA